VQNQRNTPLLQRGKDLLQILVPCIVHSLLRTKQNTVSVMEAPQNMGSYLDWSVGGCEIGNSLDKQLCQIDALLGQKPKTASTCNEVPLPSIVSNARQDDPHTHTHTCRKTEMVNVETSNASEPAPLSARRKNDNPI
jgi:hypothetical protein